MLKLGSDFARKSKFYCIQINEQFLKLKVFLASEADCNVQTCYLLFELADNLPIGNYSSVATFL